MVHLRDGMELGTDDYVMKPFTFHNLKSTIECQLKWKDLRKVH